MEYPRNSVASGYEIEESVTLAEDLVKMVDRAAAKGAALAGTRAAASGARAARARREADKCDRDLLNRHADALNAEVEDALRYQADL